MISVENVSVYNIARAVYSARNAMDSWEASDSDLSTDTLGEKDLNLAIKLAKAGSPHRKYLRQIMVIMDITAPLYWWKEMDTYKVGTTSNSCSTMHKIHSKMFKLEDFSHENLSRSGIGCLEYIIAELNSAREMYVETKNKRHWWDMIQILPTSYNQKRTITMNYENVLNILQYRQGHKLDEWNAFCVILKSLPYVEQLIE